MLIRSLSVLLLFLTLLLLELNAARRASRTVPDAPTPSDRSPSSHSPPVQASSPRKSPLASLPSEDVNNRVKDKFSFPPTPIEETHQTTGKQRPARAGSSALSRALNLATKKLWGTTPSTQNSPTLMSGPSGSPVVGYPPIPFGDPSHPSSPVKAAPNGHIAIEPRLSNGSPKPNGMSVSPRTNGMNKNGLASCHEISTAEDKLLAGLENLAQKVEVITKWADELFEQVRVIPQSRHLL